MRRVRQVLIALVVIILLGLPFALLLLRSPQVKTLFPAKPGAPLSDRYSAKSAIPGYTLTLADTSYLDYVAAKLDIFAPNAVTGIGLYTGGPANTGRRQITRIAFELVRVELNGR